MKYYLLLCLASLLFSSQFVFLKKYQTNVKTGYKSAFLFSFLTNLFGALFILLANKFVIEFTINSLILAFFMSIVSLSLAFFSIRSLKVANLSLYTMFMMSGGMIVPFIYGIIIGENITLFNVIGIIVILIASLMQISKSSNKSSSYFIYIAIFVLNGFSGVLLNMHQASSDIVSPLMYIFWYSLITMLISGMILCVYYIKDKNLIDSEENSKKYQIFFSTAMYPLVNCTGSLLLLLCASYVNASVQYPIITGGCILFSSITGLFFNEKLTVKTLITIIIAFLGTLLFII